MHVRPRRVATAPLPRFRRGGGSGGLRPAAAGRRFRAWRPAAGLLACLLAVPALPGLLGAQATPTSYELLQLQREYEAARSACDAAIRVRDVEQDEYQAVVDTVYLAERAGNRELWDAAQRRMLQVSAVIAEHSERIRERCGIAEQGRAAYLDGLDARRRGLEAELDGGPSPSRRGDIQALLDDISNRYRELEEEGRGLELRFAMRPVLDIDSRDTPDAVRNKAAFLEREIQQADSVLVSLDREIERLEARLRSQRNRENFQASLGRFDDVRTPVGSDPRGGEETPALAPDSTALSGGSLEAKLEATRSARLQLEHYRDQMRQRVREFREYLRTIT